MAAFRTESPSSPASHRAVSLGRGSFRDWLVASVTAVRPSHSARVHRCGNANNCEWQNRLPSSQIKPNPDIEDDLTSEPTNDTDDAILQLRLRDTLWCTTEHLPQTKPSRP